jgi:DNA polymerase V
VYLKHIAPEDIYVYSIDEVFIDATPYLHTYGLTAREFAMRVILDVLDTTGITATAGIGTNMYLAKVAMDIMAKHIRADKNGVRIAELDEMSYRRSLWTHRPLTDFWRVGRGYAKKLEKQSLYTMGDIARCSLGQPTDYYNEDLLYKMFGVNAELLIDHAWGWEPCTMAEIHAYKPNSNGLGAGQVLMSPYTFGKAKVVIREMTDLLALDLVDKGMVTDQIVLTVGYDIENLADSERRKNYHGPVISDHYGREIPKHAHGTRLALRCHPRWFAQPRFLGITESLRIV